MESIQHLLDHKCPIVAQDDIHLKLPTWYPEKDVLPIAKEILPENTYYVGYDLEAEWKVNDNYEWVNGGDRLVAQGDLFVYLIVQYDLMVNRGGRSNDLYMSREAMEDIRTWGSASGIICPPNWGGGLAVSGTINQNCDHFAPVALSGLLQIHPDRPVRGPFYSFMPPGTGQMPQSIDLGMYARLRQ